MKHRRFEEAPVWKDAAELGERVLLLADRPAFRAAGARADLRDQIQRAALAVSNTIAAGFEHGSDEALIEVLNQAKGSAGEVRSMLRLCLRLPWFGELRSEVTGLITLSESISQQLQRWADALALPAPDGERPPTDAAAEERPRARERSPRELGGEGGEGAGAAQGGTGPAAPAVGGGASPEAVRELTARTRAIVHLLDRTRQARACGATSG